MIFRLPQDKPLLEIGDQVEAYLLEKLSPGQVLQNKNPGFAFERYYFPKIRDPRECLVLTFRISGVPSKYWYEVIRPGVDHLANRLKFKLKTLYGTANDGYFELSLEKSDNILD